MRGRRRGHKLFMGLNLRENIISTFIQQVSQVMKTKPSQLEAKLVAIWTCFGWDPQLFSQVHASYWDYQALLVSIVDESW